MTMARLDRDKLHTRFAQGATREQLLFPRCYTLTHSDATGDLFLTVAPDFARRQISGWYTRVMRDEVLAEWKQDNGRAVLQIHCHVSGGLVVGSAGFRDAIFQHELPLVIKALRFGDRRLFDVHPELDRTPVLVHFHSKQRKYDRVEDWGHCADYAQ
jgi:hypothetical protein